jgi:hypothetical protein
LSERDWIADIIILMEIVIECTRMDHWQMCVKTVAWSDLFEKL